MNRSGTVKWASWRLQIQVWIDAGGGVLVIKGQQDSQTGQYVHDEAFYRYIQQGATRSARIVVPLIVRSLNVQSIVDVGCGAGAWLSEYHNNGVLQYLGIDGDHLEPNLLQIPSAHFMPLDISLPFDLGRRFDLAQCLEVGEHIESSASQTLIANLVKHSDFVLFSAAVPGQGGENHVNEQPYEFWREIFAQYNYSPYDFVRPLLRSERKVEVWYRHNTMLYVSRRASANLSPDICNTEVPQGVSIADLSSVTYRIRRRILSRLPVVWLSRLAVLKRRVILLYRAIVRRDSPRV